ncbi:MAG: ParA family protein [Rikenellaceae bacterium]
MGKTQHIAFSTQKGGAGKTTLTVLLASYLHYVKGYKIAVLDCDYPQHSIVEMRGRDVDNVKRIEYYRKRAYEQFTNSGKKAYIVEGADADSALMKADALVSNNPDLDFIFFDLPGTMNSDGLVRVLSSMDYIFTPITADKVVLDSSIRFASTINEKMISVSETFIKGIYMFWNMVDRRERREIYDAYEQALSELGIPIMETTIPDSKRFRRELSEINRQIFRSTLFPADRALYKASRIEEFSMEFLRITERI